jgi:hypothetical protein
MLGLASCSDNRAAPTVAPAEPPAAIAPATGVSPAPEPVWIASGPAQATIPEAFRGRWDATAESCLDISDAELKVADGSLTFWEVGVDVQAVTPVGANVIRIEGKGYEADEHFEWTGVVQLSPDGNMLTMNPGPSGFVRVRCLTPDFPGAEKQ